MIGWHYPSPTGRVVQQRLFGKKVGHVHVLEDGWAALFDGIFLGSFSREAEARAAVEKMGSAHA